MDPRELERVARSQKKKFPGRWDLGGLFATHYSFCFQIQGRPATLELPSSVESDRSELCTRVLVDLRGLSPGVLKIYPEGFATSIAKFFGGQDIRIGDRAFDALYVVKANPESLAHQLFREDRRDGVIAAVRRIGARMSPLVDLSRDRLRVQVGEPLSSDDAFRLLIPTASELVGFLLENPGPITVLWQQIDESGTGQCPVCGSRMSSGLVRCSKCRTPHHRECWDYVGACSTYACGGKTPA